MRNLTEGTKVLVSNGGTLKERIYLFTNDDGLHICVHAKDELEYQAGQYFRVGVWSVLETINEDCDCVDFKYGEEVLVSNAGEVFTPRIFLGRVGGMILTVHKEDEEKFLDGKLNFRTALWNEVRD